MKLFLKSVVKSYLTALDISKYDISKYFVIIIYSG